MNILFNKIFDVYKSNINIALMYSYATIFFQVIITPATIVILTRTLTGEEQGYYYTFLSLISLQGVFELGLFAVIVNKTSSLCSNLKKFDVENLKTLDVVRENIASFYRLTKKLYYYISCVFFLSVTIIGFIFFRGQNMTFINDIQILWIIFCFLYSIQIFFLGLNSFLEGCGEIENVEKWRLISYVSSGITLIVCLIYGLGLSSLIFAALPRIIKDVFIIKYIYRGQFKVLKSTVSTTNINYREEVYPMQSKLALSGIFSYLQQGIFVPIIFSTLGPVEAGAIGVALQVTSFVQQILTRIVHINQPKLASLVAVRKYDEVDALILYVQRFTLKASLLVLIGFTFSYYFLELFDLEILERLPKFWIFFLLILSACAYGQLAILIGYLRSFVEEKVHLMSITSAGVNVLLCYIMIDRFGLFAVSVSYFVSIACVSLPWARKIVSEKKNTL